MRILDKQLISDAQVVENEDLTIEATIHAEVVDREGDLILLSGIDTKNYEKCPVLLVDHLFYADNSVGNITELSRTSGTPKRLRARMRFDGPDIDEKAYRLYRKYQSGSLRGFSVTWRVLEEEQRLIEGRTVNVITKCEMIEVSCVAVPMNQESTKEAAMKHLETVQKSLRLLTSKTDSDTTKSMSDEKKPDEGTENKEVENSKAIARLEGKVDALADILTKSLATVVANQNEAKAADEGDEGEEKKEDEPKALSAEEQEEKFKQYFKDRVAQRLAERLTEK